MQYHTLENIMSNENEDLGNDKKNELDEEELEQASGGWGPGGMHPMHGPWVGPGGPQGPWGGQHGPWGGPHGDHHHGGPPPAPPPPVPSDGSSS